MIKIALLPILVLVLSSCNSADEKKELSNNQIESVKQFNSMISTALLAVDASGLYDKSGKTFPKAVADEIKDCDKRLQRDSSGRIIGSNISGADCPIRARWFIQERNTTSSIELSYRSQDDQFKQILPIELLTLNGTRRIERFGAGQKVSVQYKGRARDTSEEVVEFSVVSEKYINSNDLDAESSRSTYYVSVSFGDFKAEGRIENESNFFINNKEVASFEFDQAFFILK